MSTTHNLHRPSVRKSNAKLSKSSTWSRTILIDAFIEHVAEEEESHSFIVSIRNELIENVLNKCYEKYLEKHAVSFIVHCVEKALLQLIHFEFLYHDVLGQNFDVDVNSKAAIPPEPSPPDTWAYHSIPISKNFEDAHGNLFDVPCEGRRTVLDNMSDEFDNSISVSVQEEQISMEEEATPEEQSEVIEEKVEEEEVPVDEEICVEATSELSFFKTCVETQQNELPSIPWNCWPKEEQQHRETKTFVSYATSKLLKSYSSKIISNSKVLPPIRLRSKIVSETVAMDKKLKTVSKTSHNKKLLKPSASAVSFRSE